LPLGGRAGITYADINAVPAPSATTKAAVGAAQRPEGGTPCPAG